jgi:hypothetical protein
MSKTKLALALSSAAATGLLAGCIATVPTNPDSKTGPEDNVPRPVQINNGANQGSLNGTNPSVGNTNNVQTANIPKAPIKWGQGDPNKVLTENKIKTDTVQFTLVQGFATQAATPAAPAARVNSRKEAMPGTKDATNARTSAATTVAAATTTATIDPNKPSSVFVATVSLSECTYTAGNVLSSITGSLGGIGATVGNAAKQAANRAGGGGLTGRAMSEGVGAATTTTTVNGQRVANDKNAEVSAGCNAQIVNFIGDLKNVVNGLSGEFAKNNNGAKAAYTITTELPDAYAKSVRAAVGQPEPTLSRR